MKHRITAHSALHPLAELLEQVAELERQHLSNVAMRLAARVLRLEANTLDKQSDARGDDLLMVVLITAAIESGEYAPDEDAPVSAEAIRNSFASGKAPRWIFEKVAEQVGVDLNSYIATNFEHR